MSTIIVDLDGTVADNSWRGPYDYMAAGDDPAIENIVRLVRLLADTNSIVYMTGREEHSRAVVTKWLALEALPLGALYMRPDGDDRPDEIVKAEMFEAAGLRTSDVWFVLDDRARVIAMWRAMGLTVLDVAGHTF